MSVEQRVEVLLSSHAELFVDGEDRLQFKTPLDWYFAQRRAEFRVDAKPSTEHFHMMQEHVEKVTLRDRITLHAYSDKRDNRGPLLLFSPVVNHLEISEGYHVFGSPFEMFGYGVDEGGNRLASKDLFLPSTLVDSVALVKGDEHLFVGGHALGREIHADITSQSRSLCYDNFTLRKLPCAIAFNPYTAQPAGELADEFEFGGKLLYRIEGNHLHLYDENRKNQGVEIQDPRSEFLVYVNDKLGICFLGIELIHYHTQAPQARGKIVSFNAFRTEE